MPDLYIQMYLHDKQFDHKHFYFRNKFFPQMQFISKEFNISIVIINSIFVVWLYKIKHFFRLESKVVHLNNWTIKSMFVFQNIYLLAKWIYIHFEY